MTGSPALEVLATGPLALVQDLGRPGYASMGVSPSGAADRASYRLGSRLLANREGAAAVEVTFGGLAVQARGDLLLALTGAPAAATLDGPSGSSTGVGFNGPFMLRDGHTLRLERPTAGLRTYLSVHGGVDVPAVLGSRSTDVLSGLGPPPLAVGDVLPIGGEVSGFPLVDIAPVRGPSDETLVIRALLGPREDWLADPGELAATSWTVSGRSDRVGVRLEGVSLQRHPSKVEQELLSEGVVRGSIQVPPSGEPVLFLADHPVTGGYPVAAVLHRADVDLVAQAAPGQRVRMILAQ